MEEKNLKLSKYLRVACLLMIVCFFLPFVKACDKWEYPFNNLRALSDVFLFKKTEDGFFSYYILIAYFLSLFLFIYGFAKKIPLLDGSKYFFPTLFFIGGVCSMVNVFYLRGQRLDYLIFSFIFPTILLFVYGVTFFLLRRNAQAFIMLCLFFQILLSTVIHGFCIALLSDKHNIVVSPFLSFPLLVFILYSIYKIEMAPYPKGYFLIWKKI